MAAEPDRWDYSAAGVPSALTEDLEAAQAAKKSIAGGNRPIGLVSRVRCSRERSWEGKGLQVVEQGQLSWEATSTRLYFQAEKKARQKAKEQERKAAANEKKKKAEEDAKAAMVGPLHCDDEIARAVAEASKATAKMKQPASSQAGGKVGAGKKGAAGAAAAAAQPLSPEELARRREIQAAAAEARMRALQAASASQRLY
eukprot:714872-Pelagomonas_calceolata.AAC.3